MTAATNPQVNARVPGKIQRLAKAKAALLGIGYGEYLTKLIEKDVIDIIQVKEGITSEKAS